MAYDKQSVTDVARFYDIYDKGNLFERVPYLAAGAIQAVINQQTDAKMATLMKSADYRRIVDNTIVDRLVKDGFFQKLFGPSIKAEEDRKPKLALR
jgi:hypothetical protein